MSIVDKKKKVFGQIAAMKTLNEGLPKFKLSSSLSSITNKTNSLDFLSDLLKSLVGYEKLRTIVTDILVNDLPTVELGIKKALKSELKSIVNCGVNPSIPTFLKYGNTGIETKVKQIDFFDILLVDPLTSGGGLIYDDVESGINSTDFNTFIYNTLQSGAEENWGGSTHIKNNILSVKFNQQGVNNSPNNMLKINASEYYSSNNKTLTDFNNDYIDSVKLFGTEKVINNIIDSLFGSISITINKSKKQLENEEKIKDIVNRLVNTDESDVVDNSFFTFSNDDVSKHQEIADNRKKGVRDVKTNENLKTSVSTDFLTTMKNGLNSSTSNSQINGVVNKSINDMADFSSLASSAVEDRYSIKLDFIQNMLNTLIQSIVNIILSPKIITIFLINFKILYGPTATFDNAVDFLKKNKTLINEIINKIKNIIIEKLLKIALKEISIMVAEAVLKIQTEKYKLHKSKLLSLIGVSPDIIRIIQGIA